MLKVLGETKNGIKIYEHEVASHSHRPDLNQEAISLLTINEGQTFIKQTVDFGRIIGEDHLVKTTDYDIIHYAVRGNRPGQTRFVLNKKANPTTIVTIIACVDRNPGETQGLWCLKTLFEGDLGEKEPWDPSIKTEQEKRRCYQFWSEHALVPTQEEFESFGYDAEYFFSDYACDDADSESRHFNTKEEAIKWLLSRKENLGEDFYYGGVYDASENEVFKL